MESVDNLPKTYLQIRCGCCSQKYYEHEINKYGLCEKCYTAKLKMKHRNPKLAALLSLIFPGVGSIYNGDPIGAIFFFAWGFCFFFIITWLLMPLIYFMAVVHAYAGSKKVNNILDEAGK